MTGAKQRACGNGKSSTMERFGQVRANCVLASAPGSMITMRVSNLRPGRLEHSRRACRVRMSAQPGEMKTETSENDNQGDGQMKIRRRPPDGPEGTRMANILWKVCDFYAYMLRKEGVLISCLLLIRQDHKSEIVSISIFF